MPALGCNLAVLRKQSVKRQYIDLASTCARESCFTAILPSHRRCGIKRGKIYYRNRLEVAPWIAAWFFVNRSLLKPRR
jgi:hypothetical protein